MERPNQHHLAELPSTPRGYGNWRCLCAALILPKVTIGSTTYANVIYAATETDMVYAIDGLLLGKFRVGNQPSSVAFDGSNVWVTNAMSTQYQKSDAAMGKCCVTSLSAPL